MTSFANTAQAERELIINEVAARMGVVPLIVEKTSGSAGLLGEYSRTL
jgi:hypothetical protein